MARLVKVDIGRWLGWQNQKCADAVYEYTATIRQVINLVLGITKSCIVLWGRGSYKTSSHIICPVPVVGVHVVWPS